jgi:hypothetical protein
MAEHFAMHEDHAQWTAEWLDWEADASRWHEEQKGIVERLAEVERRLRNEAKELLAYRDAVRALAGSVDRHEQEMARHERGGRGEEHEPMAEHHHVAARRQAQAREEHRRRGARRREIAELTDRLLALLGPPSPPQ